MNAGGMEQELRFDAVDVGRVEQRFEEVLEQGLFDLVGGERDGVFGNRGVAGFGIEAGPLAAEGEDVADDGLGFFVDAEGIAGDLSGLDGRVTGEHVAVKVLHEELGAGAIVPVEALAPDFGLGIEHRAEQRRREVPEVENLDGNAGCHGSPGYWTAGFGE